MKQNLCRYTRHSEPPQDFNPHLPTDFPVLVSNFIAQMDRSDRTARSYANNLNQFVAWMNYAGVKTPGRENVIHYREWLLSEHDAIRYDPASADGWTYRTDAHGNIIRIVCKPDTVAQYIRIVRQFFHWAALNGYYRDIAADVRAPKVRNDVHHKDALKVEDVQTIEISIKQMLEERILEEKQNAQKEAESRIQRSIEQGKRLYAMFLLVVNLGLRVIEVVRANVKDFFTRGGQSWLWIWGKGHSEPDQKKPMARAVAEAIWDYLQSRADYPARRDSPLFVATGNRNGGKRLAATTVSKMLKQAMRNAGYDDERLTAHSLRHTTGTLVQEITRNLYDTQNYMRHDNPSTTELYLQNETEKREAIIAQQLYDLCHGNNGNDDADQRAKLNRVIDRMNPEQIEQITNIAVALCT